MIKIRKTTIFILSLCSFLFIPESLAQNKIKVMPLGDSICEDNQPFLRQQVTQEKLQINWVGSKKNSALADPEHECHGGWSAAQVLGLPGTKMPCWEGKSPGNVSQWVKATKPDVVLMMLGSNDFFADNCRGEQTSNTLKTSLEKIVDEIYKNSPGVHIAIASLSPFNWQGGKESQQSINLYIQQMVKQRQQQGQKISFVDIHNSVPQNGFKADNLHLNDIGNQAIAKTWIQALKKI
ncbi:GDSL-type esterase/lipase family protein [Calothrix sp. 336/3]|uniref:GDSL-type esterase/lipase family protein n=1 Tax=Calothrix sp. 336/3 TaxID=1337936 RepID=UPI0004E3BC29|nr:GDSL-type esterase/lipase family protein [Calothrix sp. 336/3]AKG20776.1 hypothetical protein IJ00_05145 [Calothrix sp. 336/3]